MLASFLGVLPILTPPLRALAFIITLYLFKEATSEARAQASERSLSDTYLGFLMSLCKKPSSH
jgi:hypothetical protein